FQIFLNPAALLSTGSWGLLNFGSALADSSTFGNSIRRFTSFRGISIDRFSVQLQKEVIT
ncbi:MAG: hypothetical protein ABUT20_10040, partial [Bacteroidota bacterium]